MQKWVYKLVCSNPECRHEEIDEFQWETCRVCGSPNIIVDKWQVEDNVENRNKFRF